MVKKREALLGIITFSLLFISISGISQNCQLKTNNVFLIDKSSLNHLQNYRIKSIPKDESFSTILNCNSENEVLAFNFTDPNNDYENPELNPTTHNGSLIGSFVGLAAVFVVAFVVIYTSERRRKFEK